MTNAKGTRRSLNYNGTCIAAPATGSETYIAPSEAFREQICNLDSDIQRRNVSGTDPSYSYDARAPRGVSPARNTPPTPNVAAEDMFGYARVRRYIPTIMVIYDFEGTRHNDPQATRPDAASHVHLVNEETDATLGASEDSPLRTKDALPSDNNCLTRRDSGSPRFTWFSVTSSSSRGL